MEDTELRSILFSIQGSIIGLQSDMSDMKNDGPMSRFSTN